MIRPAGPGVFTVTGSPPTWQQRLSVVTLAVPDAVVSHQSAARLHGFEAFADEDQVIVTVKRGRRVRVPDVVVHQVGKELVDSDTIEVDGFRTTSLARTVVDLGSVVAGADLVRVCDEFERRGKSTMWLSQVASRLQRPGQRGPNAVLEHLAVRAQQGRVSGSWFERLMTECLDSAVLPKLVAQYVINDADGEFLVPRLG